MRRLRALLHRGICGSKGCSAKVFAALGLLALASLTEAFGPHGLLAVSSRGRTGATSHRLWYSKSPLERDSTVEESDGESQAEGAASRWRAISSKPLLHEADGYLEESTKFRKNTSYQDISGWDFLPGDNPSEATSRRMFMAAAAFALGAALDITAVDSGLGISAASAESLGKLKWEATPVNRRTGVTLFDAEKQGYNLSFVTYLSRFLLCFDEDCQKWWYSRATELPRLAKAQQIDSIRYQQFAAFSASVEVGLQFYGGANGPKQLLGSLIRRYCPDADTLRAEREEAGLTPLGASAEEQKLREIEEARRQITILFGLMEENQPVDDITTLLAAIDNGFVSSIEIVNPGAGYAPGYGAPFVQFPPPDGGPDYETATGRAELVPNGKILRLDVINRGFGYQKPPTVTISPPEAAAFATGTAATAAEGRAVVFKQGPNKGRVEKVVLTDPGAGYSENEIIKVKLSPPDMSSFQGGVTATAKAVLEYEVGGITIVKGGSGYAVEKPINVYVEPPPITARVNMNDPLTAQTIPYDQLLPTTTVPSKEMKRRMNDASDPSSATSTIQRLAWNDGKGGGGGCVGRACYDRSVEVIAFSSKVRSEDDATKTARLEMSMTQDNKDDGGGGGVISGSTSGPGNFPLLPKLGSVSSSTQLLSLLPEGIGLQYDREQKRYIVRATPEILDQLPAGWFDGSANKPLDPEFGPRGRSPIEREKTLGFETYLRFAASGAVCCSAVHLVLTPIDVVKTKVQTNPVEYPGVTAAFRKVLASGGPSSFFTGWAPTFVGFFVWGGVTYALTEYLRRLLTSSAGLEAGSLEVPIILCASAISGGVGSFILCPFEAVRIRSVALSGSGKAQKNVFEILNKIIEDEGIKSLFFAVPAFLAKELPFNMSKFTIFTLFTAALYDAFPVAREDLQLSLLVSLAGGTLGGVVAAIVSNPADATITEMKKAKSKRGPLETAQALLQEGGPPRLFAGVYLRMTFYSLIVSLQFLVYDSVRFALGIGADDLKLYLDVLGGALSETGGPL